MCKQLFILLTFLCLATPLLATHNYAGEIFFRKTGGLGLEATIITYTRASSVNADRDTLTIHWGDGSSQELARNNGFNNSGELLGNDIKKNTYAGIHTYAAEGIYWLSMNDPNRSAGIININPPNSDNIPFHLEAMVRLLPDAAESLYSPFFLEPPVDVATLQQPFVHVPNAFDADGDSLVYELNVPLQGPGTPVPNYFWPNEIAAGPNNIVMLDASTGKLSWNVPQEEGAYGISMVVRAFRNGKLVEETRRDMLMTWIWVFMRHPLFLCSRM